MILLIMEIKLCKQCNKIVKERYRKLCWPCRNKKYYTKYNEKKRINYDPTKKREYYLKNRDNIIKKNGQRHIKKRKTDLLYKLADYLRSRVRVCLMNQNIKKTSKLSEYLGISIKGLKLYLEIQFKDGMTWENYGKWHIDHIVPLSSAKTSEELYKLCHYTNLQPLWAIDNLKKGAKTPSL